MSFPSVKKLPSLCWLATALLTLGRSKGSSIIAFITITSSICSPVSSNTHSINPYLALPHSSHVYSQWLISFRCIKVALRVKDTVHTFKGHLIFRCKIKFNLGTIGTLCQVSGCGACAANDPSIHSTEDIPFGDTRFMASPFSPTYFKGVTCEEKFVWYEIITFEKLESNGQTL